jgi:hypothetical protein
MAAELRPMVVSRLAWYPRIHELSASWRVKCSPFEFPRKIGVYRRTIRAKPLEATPAQSHCPEPQTIVLCRRSQPSAFRSPVEAVDGCGSAARMGPKARWLRLLGRVMEAGRTCRQTPNPHSYPTRTAHASGHRPARILACHDGAVCGHLRWYITPDVVCWLGDAGGASAWRRPMGSSQWASRIRRLRMAERLYPPVPPPSGRQP